MHICPECGQACYCDLEDHESESSAEDCVHFCAGEDRDFEFETYE